MLAKSEIRKSESSDIFTFGIKLTGGCSKLSNIVDLANEIFSQPVKISKPQLNGGISENLNEPEFSNVVGLINYINNNLDDYINNNENITFNNLFNWIKNFIKNLY